MSAPWIKASPRGHYYHVYCEACGAQALATSRIDLNAFAMQHANHYSEPGWVGAGDAVHEAASALGIETCTPCEKRRRRMNRWLPRLWRR